MEEGMQEQEQAAAQVAADEVKVIKEEVQKVGEAQNIK